MSTTPVPLPHARALATLAALAGLGLVLTTTVTGNAAEDPTLQTLTLSTSGGYATAKALAQDSDGDSWCDWYERLEGTDPYDARSFPGSTHLEIIGTTAFVQSTAFPDRLAIIDLALPEGTTAARDLLDTVGTVAGLSPTGKLHQQLSADLARLTKGGLLNEMLAAAEAVHGTKDSLGPRTNGMDLSLISSGLDDWQNVKKAMEAADFVRHNDISVGTTTDGDPYVTVRNAEGSQTHVFMPDDEVSSLLISKATDGDGSKVVFWTQLTNGTVTGWGKQVTHPDGTQENWEYDADGNLVSHTKGKVGPVGSGAPQSGAPQSGAPQSGAPQSASPQPSGSASASADPSTDPSPGSDPASPSASDTMSNPDADPLLVPTADEVAARIAFLAGVRVHTLQDKPEIGTSELLPEPGVTDPAEPECSNAGCLVFVEVQAPRLSNVPGGDPVPFELQGLVPRGPH